MRRTCWMLPVNGLRRQSGSASPAIGAEFRAHRWNFFCSCSRDLPGHAKALGRHRVGRKRQVNREHAAFAGGIADVDVSTVRPDCFSSN